MTYVKKAYEMMFFWIGFGGIMAYLSYTFSPYVGLLRSRPSFTKIRYTLTAIPAIIFPYHGIKFMIFYKSKGAREVAKDSENILSEEDYQLMV